MHASWLSRNPIAQHFDTLQRSFIGSGTTSPAQYQLGGTRWERGGALEVGGGGWEDAPIFPPNKKPFGSGMTLDFDYNFNQRQFQYPPPGGGPCRPRVSI